MNTFKQTLFNYRIPFLAIFLIVAIGLFYWPSQAATPVNLAGTSIVADIAAQASDKVVWIITTYERNEATTLRRLFSDNALPKEESHGQGSGFFFDSRGYILTNAHVIEGAKTITVKLSNSKKELPATLVGKDTALDIAVLKVQLDQKVSVLNLGDSQKSRIGEWVVAIGNPLGLDHTVTLGIISAKGRPIRAASGNTLTHYENMIQTDAAINPGNSGGPLLNLKGEVIGINTAVSQAGQGLGFAIPINSVKEILNELITKGKVSHPWLGVSLGDVSALDPATRDYLKVSKPEGVIIVPLKNQPAAKAGLKPYDIILEINHQQISDSNALIQTIRKKKVGDKLKILISRQGRLLTKEVILEEKPN